MHWLTGYGWLRIAYLNGRSCVAGNGSDCRNHLVGAGRESKQPDAPRP